MEIQMNGKIIIIYFLPFGNHKNILIVHNEN